MNGSTEQKKRLSLQWENSRRTAEMPIQLLCVSTTGKNLIYSDFVAKYQLTH